MSVGLFARLEIVKGSIAVSEGLAEHLANVSWVATTLATYIARSRRNAIHDPELLETVVAVSGLMHDLGKALFNISRKRLIDKALREGRDFTLTFPGHEVLSAAIAIVYGYESGLSEEEIALIARSIALHHQGLRGAHTYVFANLSKLVLEEAKSVDLKEFANALRNLANQVRNHVNALPIPTQAQEARKAIDSTISYLSTKLSESEVEYAYEVIGRGMLLNALNRANLRLRYVARTATGLLMISDNYVAKKALGASRITALYRYPDACTHFAQYILSRSKL